MKRTLLYLVLLMGLVQGFSIPIKAQQNTEKVVVEGKVIDKADGQPVIGAIIRIKGSKKGAFTDSEGKFKLLECSPSSVLKITCIGYQAQNLTIGKKRKFTIYLRQDVKSIDEVVVTGFQKLKKNSFTGTATIVSSNELKKVNSKDAVKALQSFDPSFRILDNLGFGSDPNQLHEINIRGVSSISQNRGLEVENQRLTSRTNLLDNPNMPIFMLDGFEVSVQKIYDMDINRIKSMTILKDAAATALYGSRAANGVVIVTTYPPKAGEIRVDYNASLELTFPDLSDYNLADAREKLQVEKDAGLYDGKDTFSKVLKDLEYNQKLNEIRRGVNTDWMARPLQNAYNLRNYVSLSGGVNEVRYMLDFNYDKNSGVMKGSYRNRWGAGMMIDYRLRDWLQIQNKVSFNGTNYEDSPYGYFNNYSLKLPYDAIVDQNGDYLPILPISRTVNPLWQQERLQSFTNRSNIKDLTNNLSVNLHFTKNLYLRGTFSVSRVEVASKTFRDPKDPIFQSAEHKRRGSLQNSKNTRFKWNGNLLLHFNKRINDHFFNITAGLDAQETIDDVENYTLEGFNIGTLNKGIYAAQQLNKTNTKEAKTRLFGLLSAINYTFKEIYLFDSSFRLDGSSQFGSERRFAPFASVGLGLNIHNYDFMKDKAPFINTLRLKGTYGSTGKVNFSRFDVISSYRMNSSSWYYTGPVMSLMTMGNPDLSWEKTKTLDLGVMLELFKSRFYFEANYYNKVTDGMIDQVAIRPSSGFKTFNGNVGSITNKGFELKTNITAFRNKDWSVVLNANMAHNVNEISKLDEGIEEYNKKIKENYDSENPKYANLQNRPLTMYYVGASTSAIYTMPSLGIDPASGKEIFVKKDGTITKEWNANDMVVSGDTNPDAQGSFGINVAWKRIYFNASFLYAFGGQQYNQTLLTKVENANIKDDNVDRRVITDRWRKVGDVAPFYGLTEVTSTKPTSRFVQDDNYVSFNSLSLGYDFDTKLVKKLGLSALSVSLNASNLGRWSSIKQERGLAYPYAHTYNLSLRVSY